MNIIHSQTGGINESDVMLASASEAVIIGFNVRPLVDARRAAAREGVDVRTYSVIYKITEDLRNAMEGLLDSLEVEETDTLCGVIGKAVPPGPPPGIPATSTACISIFTTAALAFTKVADKLLLNYIIADKYVVNHYHIDQF
jgi:hypothetical protein